MPEQLELFPDYNSQVSILDHVIGAISATVETLGASHLNRPAGSYVEKLSYNKAHELLRQLPYKEVTEQAKAIGVAFGNCRYFEGELPEYINAYECIALLGDLTDEDLSKVNVAKGHHGQWELQTISESIAPRKTNVIHLITGEHEGKTVVFTWYPGAMTPPLSAGITDRTAVKLVQKQVAS